MNSLSSLLCLTSDYSILSHSEQVRILLEEGAKFIQIRTKELSSHNLFDQFNIASKYAIENDATLIVNDFLDIANQILARPPKYEKSEGPAHPQKLSSIARFHFDTTKNGR